MKLSQRAAAITAAILVTLQNVGPEELTRLERSVSGLVRLVKSSLRLVSILCGCTFTLMCMACCERLGPSPRFKDSLENWHPYLS